MRNDSQSIRKNRRYFIAVLRVLRRVDSSDSLGTFCIRGLMAQASANGMSLERERLRHSASTPPSTACRLQYPYSRQRNPLPFPGGSFSSLDVPGLSISEISFA